MGWLNTCSNKKEAISSLTTILQNKTEQVRTLSGNLAQKSEVWQIEKQELKKIRNHNWKCDAWNTIDLLHIFP